MKALLVTLIMAFVLPFMLYAAAEDTVRLVGLWREERAFQRWRQRWPQE